MEILKRNIFLLASIYLVCHASSGYGSSPILVDSSPSTDSDHSTKSRMATNSSNGFQNGHAKKSDFDNDSKPASLPLSTFEVNDWRQLSGTVPFAGVKKVVVRVCCDQSENVAQLNQFSNLEELYMPVIGKVTDQTILTLGPILPHLRTFSAPSNIITDEGLSLLAKKATRLQILDLTDNTRITNKGMPSLAGLPLLELSLYNTGITSGSKELLKSLKTLTLLDVRRTELTKDDINEIKREIPALAQPGALKTNRFR